MIRLKTRILVALIFMLFSKSIWSSYTLFHKDEFTMAVVRSPVGSYYGNPYIRYIAEHLDQVGVHVIYIKPTITKTRIPSNYQINLIAGKILKTSPKQVLASDSLIKRLKEALPFKWHSRLRPFSFVDLGSSYIEQYSMKLRNFIESSNFSYDRIYILHDQTPFSTERALSIRGNLIKAKFPISKITLVTIKNFHSIGAELRKISHKPPSIIINSIFVINDLEVNKLRYSDDAKQSILDNNRKHLDIGFWVARDNEALIIEPNPKDFYDYLILGKEISPVRVNLYVNKKRMNKLKMQHMYINGMGDLDGLLDR